MIPQKYQTGSYRKEAPLVHWPLDAPGVVSSVSDRSCSALRELERLGLRPGIALTVAHKNSAGSLTVQLAGRLVPIRLSADLAKYILVAAQLGVA